MNKHDWGALRVYPWILMDFLGFLYLPIELPRVLTFLIRLKQDIQPRLVKLRQRQRWGDRFPHNPWGKNRKISHLRTQCNIYAKFFRSSPHEWLIIYYNSHPMSKTLFIYKISRGSIDPAPQAWSNHGTQVQVTKEGPDCTEHTGDKPGQVPLGVKAGEGFPDSPLKWSYKILEDHRNRLFVGTLFKKTVTRSNRTILSAGGDGTFVVSDFLENTVGAWKKRSFDWPNSHT